MCFDLCITPVRTPCGAESGVRGSRREMVVFGFGPLETSFFVLFSFFPRFFSILGRILDHHAFFGRFFPILGRFWEAFLYIFIHFAFALLVFLKLERGSGRRPEAIFF